MDISLITQKLSVSATTVLNTIASSKSGDYKKAGQVALIGLATYAASASLYRAFFGPLSHIPGPFDLKFYDMTNRRDFINPLGESWKKFKAWQEEYGDVVRLGPDTIAISDKDMLRQVLLKDDLPKGPRYERLGRFGGWTLFSSVDKSFHKQRRRVVSPAFSVKYLNSLEKYMLTTTQSFIDRVDRDIQATAGSDGFGTVDIWILLQYLALDIIGETAFGQTFHMLEASDHVVPRTISKSMQLGAAVAGKPYTTMFKAMFSLSDIVDSNERLKKFMRNIIMERLHGGDAARRDDILQILIDTQHASSTEDRLTAEAIAQETVLFLIAGSETTSNTTGFAIIELMKHPEAFAKLRAEIDEVPLEIGQQLLHHEQLKKLPYLNAVINETLRLDPIDVDGLQRRADRDILLGGRLFVPKGTIILSNVYRTHLDPKYWPDPTSFKPERWLEGSDIPADTEAFFPFSIGSRNCIGKVFAQQEMRLSIANLVKFYDIRPIPEELAAADERLSFITWGVKSNSFKVHMKRRE
ncbi:cytochrome P450 [Fennellomyces sp. T-0311]|nr:cytochrome P450 [Fennellomyces sp. T-0311]